MFNLSIQFEGDLDETRNVLYLALLVVPVNFVLYGKKIIRCLGEVMKLNDPVEIVKKSVNYPLICWSLRDVISDGSDSYEVLE